MALALSSSSADQSLNEEQQQQLAYLKKELMAYLALREEVGADEEAKK
jgi:hypothetical protein